jgi:hypothetical protein
MSRGGKFVGTRQKGTRVGRREWDFGLLAHAGSSSTHSGIQPFAQNAGQYCKKHYGRDGYCHPLQ